METYEHLSGLLLGRICSLKHLGSSVDQFVFVFRHYMRQILEAVRYMHLKAVVHRDLKVSSIKFQENIICKFNKIIGKQAEKQIKYEIPTKIYKW